MKKMLSVSDHVHMCMVLFVVSNSIIILKKVLKRQLWVQPFEWLKLNFASCVDITMVGMGFGWIGGGWN